MGEKVEKHSFFWYDTHIYSIIKGGCIVKKWIAGILCFSLLFLSTACGVTTPPTATTGTITVQRPTASVSFPTSADTTTTENIITDTTTSQSQTYSGVNTTNNKPTSTATQTTTLGQNTTTTTESVLSTTMTTVTSSTTQTTKPSNPQEMRAAWVSYIEINELLQSCKTVEKAKQAIDDLMIRLAKCNLNTVFFHVRANSDAYYPSAYFRPASTIKALQEKGFDLLAYAVEAAHKQHLQIHAWINPYRIGTNKDYAVQGVPTFSKTLNNVTRYYYVPTSSATQKLVLDGVREVLGRYAVDGIQYDDYFYPEKTMQTSTAHEFESADYTAYLQSGGSLSVGNWRRAAVDSMVSSTYIAVKKAGRIFGISPAANAQNTYDDLYADCLKWLSQSGYVDYLCPQLYTGFEHQGSPFDKLVEKWLAYPRHSSVKLYVGIATYKAGLQKDTYAGTGKFEWANNTDILKRQVLYLRSKNIAGIALYSYSFLFPDEKATLNDNILSVAQKEAQNLLSVL